MSQLPKVFTFRSNILKFTVPIPTLHIIINLAEPTSQALYMSNQSLFQHI